MIRQMGQMATDAKGSVDLIERQPESYEEYWEPVAVM